MTGLSLAAFCQILNALFILYVLVGFVSFVIYRKTKYRLAHFAAYSFMLVLLGMLQFHFARVS